MATAQRIRSLLDEAARLVAEGQLLQAEAEGAIIAALNWFAPQEAGASNARKLAQMSPQARAQVQGAIAELQAARATRLTRAREGLLALSDAEWTAAGGSLDEVANDTS